MGKILAYLSHSYRPEDRAINMAVWRRLNEAGVIFAVDPPGADKRPMDITFLERMMQRSHCFVAIVPDRSRQAGGSSWSPYQEFECRLAIRANKLRMIVVEKGIDQGPLPDREPLRSFDRSSLELDSDFDAELKKFVEYARTQEREYDVLPKIGVLRWMPADPRWQLLTDELQERFPKNIEILQANERTEDHVLLDKARNLSVMIADINPSINPPFLLGLLHGAAIPVFRTCLLLDGETEAAKIREMGLDGAPGQGPGRTAEQLRLPLLFRGYQVDERVRPITFWKESSIDEVVRTIAETTEGYRNRERRLETQSNGSKYFLSLQGNRIFISTPKDFNQVSEPLKHALDSAGMPAFHYQVADVNMPVGKLWQESLRKLIAGADLLLAFVSLSYWDSEQCRYEMSEAVGRWERHQLLITVCIPESMPPMPKFLERYQAKRLKNGVDETEEIVEMVRQQFANAGDSDRDPDTENRFTQLLERHLDADTEKEFQAFLQNACGLQDADAATTAARLAASARPAAELANILVRGLQVEKFGPGALGRLCFYLRRLETDPAMRDWLTSKFSLLRLFPNLHDIEAWHRRRKRKQVEMHLASGLPRASLEVLTALAGESAKALDAVANTGSDIAKQLHGEEQAVTDPECRVAVVSDINDLMIPVEWAVLPELSDPLARIRPVFRQLPNSMGSARRESIEDLFERAAAGPPRTLLFGYGPPDLPNVNRELNEIKGVFDRHYREREWPKELTDLVPADQATWQGLYARLANSDYDILHLSGHAGWNGNTPAIRVAPGAANGEWISGSELGQWLRDSLVKFVYLSCCGAAAAPLTQEQLPVWRHNLCREVLEAGVPEVAAYFWPVSDERSIPFTRRFYEQFLSEFDAPHAMLIARRSCEAGNPLWAGSIIVRQSANTKK